MTNVEKDLNMAKKIAIEVDKKGGKTFFVGGFVRDKLIGKENKDIDIEIHGITPDVLKDILKELGTVTEMGAAFGILGLKGFELDIAQPRMEKANGRGHKDFEVFVDPFIGEKNAAMRRDFTINALMQNVLTNEILDFFGGIEDLNNGIIRHVNDDTFVEDPLRVLRAAQFAARFGFNVADETINIAKNMDLTTLAKERIFGEMEKALLKATKPAFFFEMLRKMNQLDVWFPELKALIGVPQNPIFHPEGDVWNHTMMVLNAAATFKHNTKEPLWFMIAALTHDFGKPLATTNENGVIKALKHEELGVDVVDTFLARINNEVRLREFVLNMVLNHMRPHTAVMNNSKIKTTNHMFDEAIDPVALIWLALADGTGRDDDELAAKRKEEFDFLNERLDIFFNTINQPAVTGKDLIDAGLKPGKEFKELLDLGHKLLLARVDKKAALAQVLAVAKKMGGA